MSTWMEEVLRVAQNCVFPRRLPTSCPGPIGSLALTHPPCHGEVTDGSYSYYLTFIKLSRCPRSCMEQGCGWSQRLFPHKAAATWRRGDGHLFPPSKPTLPHLLPSVSSSSRCPAGARGQRLGTGCHMTETCHAPWEC